ncbi:hypothetical protein PLESTB_001683100 [Pleodorina starrii]|uniref:Peptidase S9 prolyl oligopeptidase catalytic domain-containing protein n=1 Tax=Pleodorina starrii TaxID=330485 RepID=A0A9W6BYX9_9CHLO|nr:hypothetical protein PLESTB_001683100 [Pleodorina starrii]GLC66703.1 hypothetical protein PLESTF_000462900 [Pleodorina starrii]
MGNRESKQVKQPAAVAAAAAEPSNAPRPAPLGEWESPVSSASIAEKAVKLGGASLRSTDGSLFWLELRPSEGGRQVLVMRSPDGSIRDVTPPGSTPDAFNVRTTVYEYGGGEYCVVGETVYFTNFKDQALYAQDIGSTGASPPRIVTHGSADRGERFADASWDEGRQRLVVVSEVHKDDSGGELTPDKVLNRLMAVDVSSGDVSVLVSGASFYAYPSVSPGGKWLAWVQWDFPNMPWDHTTLFVAPLADDGTVGRPTKIAGEGSSVQQPVWSSDSSYLYFVDDKSGWWNLYRCRTPVATGTAGWTSAGADAEPVSPMEAEWGFPAWNLDRRSYQILDDGSVLAVFTDPRVAGQTLALLQPPTDSGGAWRLSRINAGMTSYGGAPAVRQAGGGASVTVAAVAASFTRGSAVVQLTATSLDALAAATEADWVVVKSASAMQIPEGYISVPEQVEFPTTFNGEPTTAHMLYYPPTNKDFTYPSDTLPPLLVKSHGGPTASAYTALSPSLQYWTSRGFALADVDYGGSTGYGTAYRNRLNGNWGEVDVQDCAAAAEWLVASGRVDPRRICISGGSAGGYTTLACLAFRKTFSAGASLYGVADPKMLAEDTHKFESRYMDKMIGPLPDAASVYEARSPLKHADQFSSPVIFFQGDQDKVVPPEQAVSMYNAIKAAGLPTALVMFPGEQHGFRQAKSIRTALEGEFFFYGKVLGFKAAMSEDLPKIEIDNLPTSQPPPSQQQ